MNKKSLIILLNTIQSTIDAIKLELGEDIDTKDAIPIQELVQRMHQNDITDAFVGIEERSDEPDNFLSGQKERDFYERFNLGD